MAKKISKGAIQVAGALLLLSYAYSSLGQQPPPPDQWYSDIWHMMDEVTHIPQGFRFSVTQNDRGRWQLTPEGGSIWSGRVRLRDHPAWDPDEADTWRWITNRPVMIDNENHIICIGKPTNQGSDNPLDHQIRVGLAHDNGACPNISVQEARERGLGPIDHPGHGGAGR
jgi:hypothetical protein